MNPEQKLIATGRTLKIIAFLSACVAFMLIGGALFIKYRDWSSKEINAKTVANEAIARKSIEQETSVDKLRGTALRYADAYTARCDLADYTMFEISNICLAASLFPILILIRVVQGLKDLNATPRTD